MPTVHVRSIECIDDNGNTFWIEEYQDIREHRPLSGKASKIKGMKSLALRDGSPVNFIDENTFEVLKYDRIVRKV
ncbi:MULTISPECIES: hypothetical protein [Rhodobacterales]|uniref:hypothetical protein n=1 Tax=Rhodobacterales TaxID=204455 RepID=UPI00237FB50F|nr:hypothetical protein [Phaeobacter gallaeciensis]MDE4098973.1 hypothetical protein [Phaeobacter gallaeciensis]MDE4107783.1 hypothetical protein [Phaeobacter gallaeciensis]MDE4112237.1 hypothetical protein [Phaeobacter gallaeciensis]MDE4116709.1 hypothetical protein [Phaeobacter gallaeciensis]MDE4121179.1 hypothetical protein [Phaeobacter gallaeciensis]